MCNYIKIKLSVTSIYMSLFTSFMEEVNGWILPLITSMIWMTYVMIFKLLGVVIFLKINHPK